MIAPAARKTNAAGKVKLACEPEWRQNRFETVQQSAAFLPDCLIIV